MLQYYEKKTKKKCKEEFQLGGNVELALARSHQFVFRIVTDGRRLLMAASSQ